MFVRVDTRACNAAAVVTAMKKGEKEMTMEKITAALKKTDEGKTEER